MIFKYPSFMKTNHTDSLEKIVTHLQVSDIRMEQYGL